MYVHFFLNLHRTTGLKNAMQSFNFSESLSLYEIDRQLKFKHYIDIFLFNRDINHTGP